jgi:hypothetical protein
VALHEPAAVVGRAREAAEEARLLPPEVALGALREQLAPAGDLRHIQEMQNAGKGPNQTVRASFMRLIRREDGPCSPKGTAAWPAGPAVSGRSRPARAPPMSLLSLAGG